MTADLAWWFCWQPDVIEQMSLADLIMWLEQANRQIKAGYTKATL